MAKMEMTKKDMQVDMEDAARSRGRPAMYPFVEMQKGQTLRFDVEGDIKKLHTLRSCAYSAAKRHDWRVHTKVEGSTLVVSREQ